MGQFNVSFYLDGVRNSYIRMNNIPRIGEYVTLKLPNEKEKTYEVYQIIHDLTGKYEDNITVSIK